MVIHHYSNLKLFFLNLGGYKEGDFEEYHYKVVTVAKSKAEAIKKAKKNLDSDANTATLISEALKHI